VSRHNWIVEDGYGGLTDAEEIRRRSFDPNADGVARCKVNPAEGTLDSG